MTKIIEKFPIIGSIVAGITIGIAGITGFLLASVTDYFIENRFSIADATPVADPYTSTDNKNTDVIQVDGTLNIGSGALTMTKQTTPVDGELGVRYDSSKAAYIGAATFFKFVIKELNSGIVGADGVSIGLGFTSSDVSTAPGFAIAGSITPGGLGINSARFLMFPQDQATEAAICPIDPTLNDTFHVALIIGGSNEGASGITTATPWFSGQTLSSYANGMFYFLKKGTGPWILQNINPHYSQTVRNPVIGVYNSTMEIYDWLVLADDDSAYNPYMQPLHYQSCAPTSGQLYDDVPEVGARWDSISGNFTFTASNAVKTGGTGTGISTVELGDDDVYCQILTDIDNASTGRIASIVLRRNPSTGEHLMVQLNTTTDNLTINSFNGTSYTQRAASAVALGTGTTFKALLCAMVLDSTITAWVIENPAGADPSAQYTSAANTFFSQNNTDHGIRLGTDTTTQIKFIRFYAMGDDGEYAGLSDFFIKSSGRRFLFGLNDEPPMSKLIRFYPTSNR